MGYTDNMSPEMKQRIVQELVPGKQISLAHIIANPDKILYTKLGLDPSLDYSRAAIGIMTVSPAETAIIMADIAMKSSGIELGFVDRFSGSLIITGSCQKWRHLPTQFWIMWEINWALPYARSQGPDAI